MALVPVAGADGDVAGAVGVDDEDVRAGHLGADAQADPLVGGRGGELEVDGAGGGGRDGGGGGDADLVVWAGGDGGVGGEGGGC